MRIVHVQTKKISSYDGKGMPIVEEIIQKVRSNGVNDEFEALCSVALATGYLSLEVVKVLDLQGKKEFKEIDKYQDILDSFIEPVEEVTENDLKAENEALKANQADLLKRLEALEAKGSEEDSSEKEYLVELRSEIKSLGGDTRGLKTVEQCESRLADLKGE